MAVRVCTNCEELMQEGYAVENDEIEYYCGSTCLSKNYEPSEIGLMRTNDELDYHNWTTDECDEEDFFILMNALLKDPTPQDMANVMDVLHNTDGAHYGPKGVLDAFITYLNEQED